MLCACMLHFCEGARDKGDGDRGHSPEREGREDMFTQTSSFFKVTVSEDLFSRDTMLPLSRSSANPIL